jgi:hypothetical protein
MSNRHHNDQTPNQHVHPDSTLSQRVDTMISNAQGMGGHPKGPKAEYTAPEKSAVDDTAVTRKHGHKDTRSVQDVVENPGG